MTDKPNGDSRPRALFILPGLKASAVATIARMLGTGGFVVPQPGCLLLVLPVGADAAESVRMVSRGFGSRVEVLLVQLAGGQLAVQRWRKGVLEDSPAPGLIAHLLPDQVLPLLGGSLDPATLPGAIPVTGGGGWLRRLLGGR